MFQVDLKFSHHFRHEDGIAAKCCNLLFSCLWSNEDFEVSHDPLRWSLYFRFALWEPEISTSGQKKIVENLPRNHINKTIFWIFDILSRYGEIGEQTDTQTDTHTDILTLFIWDVGCWKWISTLVIKYFRVPQGFSFQLNFYLVNFGVPQGFSFQLNFYFISY